MTKTESSTRPIDTISGADALVHIYENDVILLPVGLRDPDGMRLKEKVGKTRELSDVATRIRNFHPLKIDVLESREHVGKVVGYKKVRMERAPGYSVDDERINTSLNGGITTEMRFTALNRYLQLIELLNLNGTAIKDHKPDSFFISNNRGILSWSIVDAGVMEKMGS